MGDWIDLIGDKLWNLIEYFDFEPRKVYWDRNLIYCEAQKRNEKNSQVSKFHCIQYLSKMDSMWDNDNQSYLELVKYFWIGNYKQGKYQMSVRLPAVNFCKYTRESSPSLFLCRSVCRRCPSLWQYEAVRCAVAILGPCLLHCRPYRYWKEISNGFVYDDGLFFLFSILCF